MTSTVRLIFSLAAINAGGPDHIGLGTQTFLNNTVTAGTTLFGQVVDSIHPSPTSYVVGQ